MSDELKPCPFCGSAPELHKDKMLGDAWLGCMNKECTVAPYIEAPDLAERGGEFSVVEAWNRRAALSQPDEARDALIEAAQDHIDSLDAYDGNPVPINREGGTAKALRKALAAMSKEQP